MKKKYFKKNMIEIVPQILKTQLVSLYEHRQLLAMTTDTKLSINAIRDESGLKITIAIK